MTKILSHSVFVFAFFIGIGTAATASENLAPKRPDPSSVQFIDGYGDTLAAGTASVLGRMYFHRVDDDAINVEYRAALHPNPTATKVVLWCADNHAKIDFPIGADFLGPIPACGSLQNLRFLAR